LHNSLLHLLLKNGDVDISQGSVATRLGCGGVFIYDFLTNFLLSLTVEEFENRLIFVEVMGKSLVSCFLTHGVEFKQYCSLRHIEAGGGQYFAIKL